ncbi:MAG TPA: DUF5979 domain-containing protein [Thermoanaerobaculia bacterium]|nr:DUF5979 domain-containing protein [Thermoanaerobaculia bacterium]
MTAIIGSARAAFLILIAAVATFNAEAEVFTKNQVLKLYTSPATIPLAYDTGGHAGPIPVGTPAHIVYGIQVTSNNTSSSPVTVTITPPPGFVPTGTRCIGFPLGAANGTPFTSGCSLPAFNIGPLSGANDKVLIVIDGFFTQAGNFTATFNAVRDSTSEPTTLNMIVTITALPVDLSVTKQVKPKNGGTFGSTATIAAGDTVTFRIVVKNESLPAANHSTDVALGSRFRLHDTLSTPSTNDIVVGIKVPSITCTAPAGVDCPAGVTTLSSNSLYPSNSWTVASLGYPSTSLGLLPAGASFEITFDAEITTSSACSPSQNNSLTNETFFTYSNGTSSVGDTGSSNANNKSSVNVTITGVPPTGCVSLPPAPTVTVTKKLLSTPAWGSPLTYEVTITNTSSQTLTGLGLVDWVSATKTPPVTATFAPAGTNIVCTPACIATLGTSTGLIVPSISSPTLFNRSALFAPLAPGAEQKIRYDIRYDAGCSLITENGTITNNVWVTGPVSKTGSVSTLMPLLPVCTIDVVKTQTEGPTSFSLYPATVKYRVEFRNTSPTQPVTVRTMIDALSLDSNVYGDVPVQYSYSCTASNVTVPSNWPAMQGSALGQVKYTAPRRAGIRLLDFSTSAGAVFGPGGVIGCDVSITLGKPRADDAFCQGDGKPQLVNSAFMHLGGPFDTNYNTPDKEKTASVQLPNCVAVSVGKTVGPNVVAGGAVTFTLTVTNAAKTGSVSGITIHDNVPPSFTNVTWSCLAGCAVSSGSGSNVNVALNPIPAGATTTVVITANAPTVLGSYCNSTNATFDPFPPLSYFEGDQDALTKASACAQVESPPGLIVRKEVEGAPAGYSEKFQFNVQCTTPAGPYQKSVTVDWPSPGFVAVNDIPPNSTCTVTEGTIPAAPAGYAWSGSPIYMPAGGVIAIGEKGGPVTARNKLVPESCLRIVTDDVSCEVDREGKPTGNYVWNFKFRNLSGRPVAHLFLSGLPFPVTVNDEHLELIPAVTNLSQTYSVVFSGAQPGPLTFIASLHDGALAECCAIPITIELPPCDCAQVIREAAPACSFPNPAPLTYTITLRNLSDHLVENLVVVPVSPVDHVTPVLPSALKVTKEINPVAPAGQGGTIGPVTVTLSGPQAVAGNQVCLGLSLQEKDFNHCCSIVRCFRLPECTIDVDDNVHTLGVAEVARLDEGFIISNIGSSGDDGVSLDLDGAQRAGLAWRPLDAAGTLPNGAFIELRAAGDEEEVEGNVRVTQVLPGRYQITSSIDNARDYRVEVFRNGEPVGGGVSQAGINVIVIWPVAAGAELVPSPTPGNPGTIAFTLDSGIPAAWELADGSVVIGDRIRITPEESSGRTVSLQTLELRAAQIPSIVVTGVSIARDCNGNGVFDAEEIAAGAAADDNDNGIPDECEQSPAVDLSLNTGYDETTGTLMPGGTDDDDWRIVAPAPERPAKVMISPHPNWSNPLPLTRWISVDPNRGASLPGVNTISFERCFCLGADARDVILDLQLRADNEATVFLNGQTLAGPGGAFNSVVPLTVRRSGAAGDGLFTAGRNCVRVDVHDFGIFTGLNVQGSITASQGGCDLP